MSQNRIEKLFAKTKAENRAALVTYMMGYDPDYETSLEILKGLPKAGADIIELGMPFSDPMADGPTIQLAANRAFKAGATTKKIVSMVKEFRKDNQGTPIILMGYYNPIYHYGIESFVNDAIDAGVDGVIIVDLTPEEESEFTDVASPAGLSLIKLTSPTTDSNRAKVVLKNSSGFVYYISVAGITGTKSAQVSDVKSSLDNLRENTDLPIAVGFGIKTPEQAAEIAEIADGVVVGSAFVNQIEQNLGDNKKASEAVLELAEKIRAGIDGKMLAEINEA